MLHQVGRDGEAVHLDPLVKLQLADLQRELALDLGRTREHCFHHGHQPVAEAGRSRQQERGGAAADKLRIEQEEGQAGKMVAVQVAHQHGRDRIGLDLPFADGDHG